MLKEPMMAMMAMTKAPTVPVTIEVIFRLESGMVSAVPA